MTTTELVDVETLPEAVLVERCRKRDEAAVRVITRRYSRRLYRIARGILRNDTEAEDVVQEAYVRAFTSLDRFRGDATFGTWLTRIALNEAFSRRRKARPVEDAEEIMDTITSPQPDPERQAYTEELRHVLEEAVDALPETYRAVFMLRDVEGLSTQETGDGLGLGEEAVKTRLHRARAMMRREVTARIGEVANGTFQFHAPRCDRVVAAVMARINQPL